MQYEALETGLYHEVRGSASWTLSESDWKRLRLVAKHVVGSVLDVGSGKGEFLSLCDDRYERGGVEVNAARVQQTKDAVPKVRTLLADIEHGLGDIAAGTWDTVTCLEVLEHLVAPASVLADLCRIARKEVIVTVPYREVIQMCLCFHCAKWTPRTHHLHSFDEDVLTEMVPWEWQITRFQLIRERGWRSRVLWIMAVLEKRKL